MKILHVVSFVLLVIGGINWLLDAFNWNVVELIFGPGSGITRIVYILVGLSAVYLAVTHKRACRECMSGGGMM